MNSLYHGSSDQISLLAAEVPHDEVEGSTEKGKSKESSLNLRSHHAEMEGKVDADQSVRSLGLVEVALDPSVDERCSVMLLCEAVLSFGAYAVAPNDRNIEL